jgi:uncharacterized protein (DUF433 family)
LLRDYEDSLPHENTISFLDLIEAAVASQLRLHGVSLIAIRRVHDELSLLLRTPHPFSHSGLYTDGKRVFVRVAERTQDESLIEAIQRQHVFSQVILPYIKHVEYSPDSSLAERWRIYGGVVLDPRRKYGKPIVEACAIPTAILATAYSANNHDVELVADWYGVEPADVVSAVAFEDHTSRIAA